MIIPVSMMNRMKMQVVNAIINLTLIFILRKIVLMSISVPAKTINVQV